jgi:hypothetical protein
MELDSGIHIVTHSVLSLKTGCDKDEAPPWLEVRERVEFE